MLTDVQTPFLGTPLAPLKQTDRGSAFADDNVVGRGEVVWHKVIAHETAPDALMFYVAVSFVNFGCHVMCTASCCATRVV